MPTLHLGLETKCFGVVMWIGRKILYLKERKKEPLFNGLSKLVEWLKSIIFSLL